MNTNIAGEEPKPLSLEVKVEKLIYRLGEEVKIDINLTNKSTETLEVTELAIDRRSLFIQIIQPDRQTNKLLAIYGLKLKNIRLYAGQTVNFKTNFIPQIVGEHQIKVSYNGFQDLTIVAASRKIFVVYPAKK